MLLFQYISLVCVFVGKSLKLQVGHDNIDGVTRERKRHQYLGTEDVLPHTP